MKGNDKMDIFLGKIRKFNEMYGLPVNDKPTDHGYDTLVNMADIIKEEVQEFDDVINNYQDGDEGGVETLTDISDLLGDIVVYCHTFALRYGIDMESTLNIIMDSNFSKLGEDGLPIYDERGKVMKGPDYWKPEPKLQEMITRQMKGE